MPWPGGLSQRASTPASEPSQDPRPPPHKGFGFAGDRPREQDRRMVSAPLSFRGISAGRVSPLLPIRVSFPKLSLVSRLQCFLILSFLALCHQPSCLFSPSFHSHSPPPLRVPPSLSHSHHSLSWQVHVRNRPCVCPHAGGGAEETPGPGGLELWGRGLLPWWLHLQHVCSEPGPLSAIPRLQTEGPPGTAAPGPLHIERGGKRHRPTLGSRF